ncbi:MAG: Lar family restriction alleviation protein [Acidobacteria bacterium]|nr:Lar family restriction alleviation protein [Acidobacteriota bacterium]MCI0722595.1 Lar family restriction alleviation protein [Acidobacteriota bacterium]
MTSDEGPAFLPPSFLHCPFCQGTMIVIRKKGGEKEAVYQAKCLACGALGPPGDSAREAKEFWNERVEPA